MKLRTKEMKSKQSSFRPFGQRSIDSLFLTYSNPVSKKGPPLSLSDFLQKKLKQTPELPTTVKGKSNPFSSLLGIRESDEQGEAKNGENSNTSSVVEKVFLQQFKPVCTSKGGSETPSSVEEPESSDATNAQRSRKREFEGGYETQTPRKRFTDFSGALKRKQPKRVKTATEENQIPAYNHYANGRGWWDNDMEGVDNEEVGFGEVWEGVGSTTFGDIVDLH